MLDEWNHATGTDTEVSERLRGYGGTRTLVTRELVTDFDEINLAEINYNEIDLD